MVICVQSLSGRADSRGTERTGGPDQTGGSDATGGGGIGGKKSIAVTQNIVPKPLLRVFHLRPAKFLRPLNVARSRELFWRDYISTRARRLIFHNIEKRRIAAPVAIRCQGRCCLFVFWWVSLLFWEISLRPLGQSFGFDGSHRRPPLGSFKIKVLFFTEKLPPQVFFNRCH